MRRVPRREWLEWCDEQNHRQRGHLETAGPGRLVVRVIDYAPFDDVLELDLDDHGTVTRRLIDHPDAIWVDEDVDAEHRVLIASADEEVPLLLVDIRSETPGEDRAPIPDFIPEQMRGSYYEG